MEPAPGRSHAYEFYPCLVDGQPASIYVDLLHERAEQRPPGADTRYTIAFQMRDAGPHGIGTSEEGDALDVAEEAVIARARDVGVTYVGRLRSHGVWESVLYGPAGHRDALHAAASENAGERRIQVRDVPDASWSYYTELLLPDAERRQWMDDRRLVEILAEQGDVLAKPRRVEHRASFPTEPGRDAFVAAATSAGFTLDQASLDDTAERPYQASVYRTDPIELDHIHDVVMTLADAAVANGGIYERWVSSIER